MSKKPVRMKILERAFFARNVSLLLQSGVSLSDALAFVAEQTKSPSAKVAIQHMEKSVLAGKSLHEALADAHPLVDAYFIHATEVGEKSGSLEESLNYLTKQLEKDYGLSRKMRSIAVYPTIVFGVIIVYAALFSYLIFPRLEKLFSGMQTALPLLTRIILSVATWVRSWGWIVLIGIVAAAIILQTSREAKWNAKLKEWLGFHTPFIRGIVRQYRCARFFRMLSYLLHGGIPIADALKIIHDATTSATLQQAITRMHTQVESGKTFASGLANESLFPPLAARLVKVAEQSGSLEQTCDYLATYYERDIEYSTKSFSSAIEPALIIIVGIAVALLAIAIIMPIYQFTGSLSVF